MFNRQLAAVAVAGAIIASSIAPAMAKSGFFPYVRPPVGVIYVMAGPVSVILNAIIVASTQCRELTASEAGIAAILPGVGIIYNEAQAPKNMCKK